MALSGVHIRNWLQFGPLLAASMSIGCAGMEPYEPRDLREEGPKSGLFSGAAGEFVILRRAGPPGTGAQEKATESNGAE
jgi:hypothetical protein